MRNHAYSSPLRLILAFAVLITLVLHAPGTVQAACPPTNAGVQDTATNHDNLNCVIWDGQGGNDNLTNASDGKVGEMYGNGSYVNPPNTVIGDNTLTNNGIITGDLIGNRVPAAGDSAVGSNTITNAGNNASVGSHIFGNYVGSGGGTAGASTISNLIDSSAPVGGSIIGNWQDGTGQALGNNNFNLSGASTVGQNVFGNEAISGNAAGDNSISSSGGNIIGDIFGNYAAGASGDALGNNTISLTGSGIVGYQVIGNVSNAGTAVGSNNITNDGGGLPNGNLYGNFVQNGSGAAGASTISNVIASSADILGDLAGNYQADSGAALGNNTIILSGSGTVGYNVAGNSAYSGNAKGSNDITNGGGGVDTDIYGNFVSSGSGNAGDGNTSNFITSSANVGGSIYGNAAMGSGAATGANIIELTGATVSGSVFGNYGNDVNSGSSATINIGANATVSTDISGNTATNGNITSSDSQITVDGLIANNVTGNSATNNISGSAVTITINPDATVDGSVYGNSAGGSVTNSTANLFIDGVVLGDVIAGDGTDTGTIGASGDVRGIISGSSTTTANNPDGNTNILYIDLGSTSDEGAYLAAKNYIAAHPTDGMIVYGGKTYTWVNWSDVLLLLQYNLIVTWFSPNDGRFDGRPADRIATYCHVDKDTLGVLLVNNQSAGNVGTSFKISKLEALGTTGTKVDFGVNGVLYIMMDQQGNGYATWIGGVDGANGLGDFAKTFICK